MKKKNFLNAIMLLFFILSFTKVNAQWNGSSINTYTTTTNVGIGLGPVLDANLHILNTSDPTGYLSGGFPTSVSDVPAQIIQRNSFTGGIFGGSTSSNIFEIWSQIYSGINGSPAGSNKLKFVITDGGYVGINKITPSTTFDVGGDVNIDNNLTVGSDANINGNVTISLLAAASNKLGILNTSGKLIAESAPTLSISGSTLTLSNGGTINTSASIPSSADDLGNHTAIMNLNMNSHAITNATSIAGTSLNVGGGSISGGLISASSGFTTGAGISCSSLFCSGIVSISSNVTIGGNLTVSSSLGVNGNLNVVGTATCTDGVWTSDENFKKNIEPIKNIKDRLFQVIPSQYQYRKESSNYFKFDNKNHFGFIAQNVQKIFPDLTKTVDSEGHLGVYYIEFIPLLLQSLKEEDAIVKEQATKITDLENEIADLKNTVNSIAKNSTSNTGTTSVKDASNSAKATLNQNIPNPFSGDTKIGYNIATSFNQAFIGIYDLNGKEKQKVAIQPGSTEITISAGQLEAGMYVYSLIVDNSIIDSKRMVVTK